jgi:alkaline phosphatase D
MSRRLPRASLALLLAVCAGPAHALTGAARCEDGIATAARKYFGAYTKLFAGCHDQAAKGLAVTCDASAPALARGLARARLVLEGAIAGRCGDGVLATAAVGAPCAGLATASALADCLADQSAGPAADALLATAYDAVGTVADVHVRSCQKVVSRALQKLADARAKARARCAARIGQGNGDFFGRCPDAPAVVLMDKARDKLLAVVATRCPFAFAPEPDPDLDFGVPCESFEIATYDRGAGGANAVPVTTRLGRCLAAAGAHDADRAATVASPLPEPAPFTAGVAAGDATPVAFVAWTRTASPDPVTLSVATNAAFASTSIVFSATRTPDAAAGGVVKVDVPGLTPGTQYYYRFLQGGAPSRIGRIRTAPDPSSTRPVRFVWSGDSNAFFKPFTVLDQAAQDDADLFLYDGDTIYGDDARSGSGVATTRDDYHAKYAENRTDRSLRTLLATTGTVAQWDDHEVADNFWATDSAMGAQIAAGNQAFRDWMPVRENLADPQRLYRRFRWGPAEFFVVDDRSYRSPPAYVTEPACLDGGAPALIPNATCQAEMDDPARHYLGPVQTAWLQAGLLGSTATWKFVVNGPLLSKLAFLPYDRWEGYASERQQLLDFIGGHGLKNVVFLSTDIHGAVANTVVNTGSGGGSVLEVVAGAIGAESILRDLPPAVLPFVASLPSLFPSVQYFDLDRFNYARATVDPTDVTFTWVDDAGTVTKTLTVAAQ